MFSALGVPRGRLVGSPGAGSVGSVIVGETKCCSGFLARGDPVKDVAKWLAVRDSGSRLLLFLWGEQCLQLCTVNTTDDAKRTHVLIVVHGWFVWDDRHPIGAGYYTNAEKNARKYIGSQHVSMCAVEDVFREALGVPDLRLFSGTSRPNARADHLPVDSLVAITFDRGQVGVVAESGECWPFQW